ncbi:Calx-beta domain-containing protein [Roseicella aerolata]|uniref:Calx-beta domain-containing protein n=1 Tax=Roseicella aerolata TaxID=2883479 RepID=A0A9X1IJF8_9PROT|nr:Calx-beta domain-containing protein [Roseicella aerolata]MCB4825254.1 hypothetical protein [Roseicella aerolata]
MSYDHAKPVYHFKPKYEVSIGDDTVKEGGTLKFKVELDKVAKEDIYIFYKTHDGTAKAGSDYKAEYGVVKIEKGTKSDYITIKTIEDKTYEPTENMYVKIWEHHKNVDVKDGTGEGTIKDDDKPKEYKLSIKDDAGKEGEKLKFKVELDHKADKDITVWYKTEDGTAKHGHDYKGEYGKVVIKAGTDHTYIDVKTIDDHKKEATEFFKVKIWEHYDNVKPGDYEAIGKIYDNGKDYDWD